MIDSLLGPIIIVAELLWFCVLIVLATEVFATDKFYRLDPASWTVYSGTRGLPAVLAPDGSTVASFQAGTVRGNVGPAGYVAGNNSSQTGLYVAQGGADEFSIFYKYLAGEHGAHLCVDGYSTGYPVHQCYDFDGSTGNFNGASPAIAGISIAQIGMDGWYRVSITFHTASSLPPGTQVFPYVQVNPLQRFALWRGFLITGQAP